MIHTLTNTDEIPGCLTAIGVHFADTSFARTPTTTWRRQFLAAHNCAKSILAGQVFRALATIAATAVIPAVLSVASGHTDFAFPGYALLSFSTRRVTGSAVIGIGAGGIGTAISATIVEIPLPTAGGIQCCAVNTIEQPAITPEGAAQLIATPFIGQVHTVVATRFTQAKTLRRSSDFHAGSILAAKSIFAGTTAATTGIITTLKTVANSYAAFPKIAGFLFSEARTNSTTAVILAGPNIITCGDTAFPSPSTPR